VLFKSEAPDSLGDEWLTDLNPDSLQIIKGALIPPHLAQTAKVRLIRVLWPIKVCDRGTDGVLAESCCVLTASC
jgi:hypothetical protein